MPGIKFLGSKKIPWFSLGTIDATAGDADATLAVTERNFLSVKSLDNAVYVFCGPAISAIKARFLMVTNDHDAVVEVWQGKIKKDPSEGAALDCDLQRKATLTIKTGTQDVYGTTKHYADTITISNDATEDGIDYSRPAAEHMATIHWDLKGDNLVVFHGNTTVDGDCEVEVTGYS